MSRSIKKNYFLPYACCNSEKKDKKRWHKAFRKTEKQKISSSNDLEDHVTTHYRELSNPWTMGKDGKLRYSEIDLLTSIKKYAQNFYKNKNERITNERKMFYRLVGK